MAQNYSVNDMLRRALRPTNDPDSGPYNLGISPSANRNAGVHHRSGITAIDKLALAGAPTVAAVTESGSTLPNSALNIAVVAGNAWGVGGQSSVPTVSITPTANQAVRTTIAQISGATYYDIFISTDTAPKWVGRITEAQRAAGGFIISSVGTVTAGGGASAGEVDLGIVGTGLQTSANPFLSNNAYTPATPTPINCAGYSLAHLHLGLSVTDLRSLPTLAFIPFFADQQDASGWFAGKVQFLSLLAAAGQPLQQDFELEVDGSTNLVILIDTITGQGASVDVYVELS